MLQDEIKEAPRNQLGLHHFYSHSFENHEKIIQLFGPPILQARQKIVTLLNRLDLDNVASSDVMKKSLEAVFKNIDSYANNPRNPASLYSALRRLKTAIPASAEQQTQENRSKSSCQALAINGAYFIYHSLFGKASEPEKQTEHDEHPELQELIWVITALIKNVENDLAKRHKPLPQPPSP